MVMNLFILFFISLPEAFLNLIIILLFAGAKNRLKFEKNNVLRFIAALVLMLAATSIIRPLVNNVIQNIIISCFACIIIIKLIYGLKFSIASLSVVFTMLTFSTIENSYFPLIITYISSGIENFSANYHMYVLYSIPSRVLQAAVIAYLWRHEILLVTKISSRFHKAFIASSFILIFVEYSLSYLFSCYFGVLQPNHQIVFAAAVFLTVTVFNFLMFQTIYVAIGEILTKGFRQYRELEENAKLAFDELNSMLKDNRVSDAISFINELNETGG